MKIYVSILTVSLVILSPSFAFADAKDDKIAALEKQMMLMMEEIRALKAERATEKAEQATLKKKVAAIEKKSGSETENTLNDIQISMKGSAPKVTKGEFSWQPIGRIHLDAGTFNDDKVDHPNGAEFRRARIGMKGKVSKDFGYKAEVDFANDDVSLKDVYINYTGIEDVELRVGQFKSGYSLEETTSSNDITFIERDTAVDSFNLSHQIGAGVLHSGENYHVQLGVFNDDAGTQSSDDEQSAVAGRIAGTPVNVDNQLVHLGASASYREPDQANDSFDYDARAGNRLQTVDSVSSVITDSESSTVYGIEAAAAIGSLSVQGEYLIADIENRGGQNPTYDGGYGQIAWTVTGEKRPYKISKGAFGGIKPSKPLDPSRGHWGALELAGRYSHLDLNDGGLNGGELDTVTLGVNWYLNNHVRLMGNYIMADTDNNAPTPDDDPEILIFRSQVKF